tara:strand:+ start:499 stop:795 length:297 start_codon:yes stop_codon:yes gene_type:complete
MNTLKKFLKEQKQVEMYGQYQDMVQEMIDVRKENKELKKELRDWKNRFFIARELERLQKENKASDEIINVYIKETDELMKRNKILQSKLDSITHISRK